MRYAVGRALQVAGLIIVPQGIVANLVLGASVWTTLWIAAAGAAVFYVGRAVQGQPQG